MELVCFEGAGMNMDLERAQGGLRKSTETRALKLIWSDSLEGSERRQVANRKLINEILWERYITQADAEDPTILRL